MEYIVYVEDLQPGMYVSRLDRPWLESPFLFQGFTLRDADHIHEVQQVCEFVYVESAHTDPGIDLPRISTGAAPPASDNSRWRQRLKKFTARRPPWQRHSVSISEELPAARRLHDDSSELMRTALDNARTGRSVDIKSARAAVEDLTQSVMRNPDALGWMSKLKEEHEYTYKHSLSVCILSLVFGRHMCLPEAELHQLGLGAFLHDVGKMKIPLEVLDKPAALTAEELAEMKRHPEYGMEIVSDSGNVPDTVRDIILSHHERMNGSGYPQGLTAELIRPMTHMVAICDTYDAIVSKRPYKKPVSAVRAVEILNRERGNLFDPWLVDQFIQCVGVYPVGTLVELNNGETGIVVSANREARLHPRVLILLDKEGQRLERPFVRDLAAERGEDDRERFHIVHALGEEARGLNTGDLEQYMAQA